MTQLSPDAVESAFAYLGSNPRRVDAALARHVVLGEPAEPVWEALEAFQTPDGGFAHGMEPDLRTPASQGISTSVAFQYLRASGAPSDLPMVQRAVAHLLDTLDRDALVWPAIDARVDLAPHAPWWASDDLARYSGFAFNPSAELAGYLFEHASLVPDQILAALTNRLSENLTRIASLPEIYDLYPCIRLSRSPNLPDALMALLEHRIPTEIAAADLNDAHTDPFALVQDPDALGYRDVASHIAPHAERLIEEQQPDGAWRPFWNWSFVDAAAWAEAERDWSAVLTANRLIGLHRHGFIRP